MKSSKRNTTELTLADNSTVTATDFGDFLTLTGTANLASLGRSIFESKLDFVDEVIATEVEICVAVNEDFTANRLADFERLDLDDTPSGSTDHQIKVWFDDEFDDWKLISEHTGLTRDAYIARLLDCNFSVAMIGFLPGFIYLDGLPQTLQVPRKEKPSTRTRPNTLAIGGKYAGTYSLPSAAGWNCVGRIATEILDIDRVPPVKFLPGDSVSLKQISEAEFSESAIRWRGQHRTSTNRPSSTPSDQGYGTLTFLKPGMMTQIQDLGRRGMNYYAIPRGGPMVSSAAKIANAVLCNDATEPVIECHFVPPKIQFDTDATISLTGADMGWMIDGVSVGRDRTIEVLKGSILSGSPATDGCRSYISIRGRIRCDKTFGSASCYLQGRFGANGGVPFGKGDRLQWSKPTEPAFPIRLDIADAAKDSNTLPFQPGIEFHWLDSDSIKAIFSNPFSISTNSDRMGARLNGPPLVSTSEQLADSVPLLPGMIQLTPSGQCIVVLQDGQTTGGYPRIGYLDGRTLERLNQTPIGRSFQFTMADF